MRRITVIGSSCAGKSTFARRLAASLRLPHVELDALHFEPGWVEVPDEQFREKVLKVVQQEDGWVIDGNYTIARDIVWPLSDTIIWLDFSFPRVFARALWRTCGRAIFGTPCCNGNRESFWRAFSKDSILLWVIRTHESKRVKYRQLLPELAGNGTAVVVFLSPGEAEKWLKSRERASSSWSTASNHIHPSSPRSRR